MELKGSRTEQNLRRRLQVSHRQEISTHILQRSEKRRI